MIKNTVYVLLNVLSLFLACLPRKITLYMGKSLGFLMYYVFPLRWKVAYKNLKIVFPNKSNIYIKKIILKSYMHNGLLMIEFIRNASRKVDKKIYSISDQTKKILNSNEGFIFMTAHLGNWEMLIPIISSFKNVSAVVKDQSNSGGDKFFYKARNYKNTVLISKKGSKRAMLNSLYNKSVLILASDQNAKAKGVFIDFFGKPASFPKGAGYFYITSKTKIIIGFCILNKQLNYNFNLEYLDFEDNTEQKDELIVKINKIYVKMLEKEIIKYPEQYFWFHRKWDKRSYDL